MSKSLILFRHGKSDWNAGIDADHERPLAKRGIKAAKTMGKMLANIGHTPPHTVTSTAVRAVATLELAAKAGAWNTEIVRDQALYATTPERVLAFVRQLPEEHDLVMLVGHETAWSEATALLIGGGALRFPTAAMARVEFDETSWREIRPGGGQLAWFIPPRLLMDHQFPD